MKVILFEDVVASCATLLPFPSTADTIAVLGGVVSGGSVILDCSAWSCICWTMVPVISWTFEVRDSGLSGPAPSSESGSPRNLSLIVAQSDLGLCHADSTLSGLAPAHPVIANCHSGRLLREPCQPEYLF